MASYNVQNTSSLYQANQEQQDRPHSSSSAKSNYLYPYFRQRGEKLVSQLLHFRPFFNSFDHSLLLIMQCLDLELGVLICNSFTFYLLESTIRSAIILR